jgi:hypothetical protein
MNKCLEFFTLLMGIIVWLTLILLLLLPFLSVTVSAESEIVAKRTWNSKTFDKGNGSFKTVITAEDQHYLDGNGQFQDVSENISTQTGTYTFYCNTTKHLIRGTTGGGRQWFPDRNNLNEYLTIGRPQYYDGSSWVYLLTNTPTTKEGNLIEWDYSDSTGGIKSIFQIYHTWNSSKMNVILVNGFTNQVRFSYSSTGMTRSGHNLIDPGTGNVVGSFAVPTAHDANGSPITTNIIMTGGYATIQISTVGYTLPITIDPTLVTLISGTSWTTPADWNNAANTIEVIGGGGGGAPQVGGNIGAGGGGGAYSKVSNLTLSGNITYSIGVSGAQQTDGGDTWFNGATYGAASVAAKGGKGAVAQTGGLGGASASGIGDTKYSGGNGRNNADIQSGGSGGGGAGGPLGNGGTCGLGGGSGVQGGSGGGGGGGGGNGVDATGNDGTAGGVNHLSAGSGSGSAAGSPAGNGSDGSAGGGGGGSGANGSDTASNGHAGAGGAGTEWDLTHGSGGGGGGGGGFLAPNGRKAGDGGLGGLYGGGGGGAGYGYIYTAQGGIGAQGIIVITYTPAAPSSNPFSSTGATTGGTNGDAE